MPSIHPVRRLRRVLQLVTAGTDRSQSPYATPYTSQMTRVNLF